MDLNAKQVAALTSIAINGTDAGVHPSTLRALIARGLVEKVKWEPDVPLYAPTLKPTQAGWLALPEDTHKRVLAVLARDAERIAAERGEA